MKSLNIYGTSYIDMKALIFIMSMLLISMPAFALDSTISVCTDTSTLQRNVTQQFNLSGNITIIKSTENINCPFGCNTETNECKGNASAVDYGLVMTLGIGFVIFLLAADIQNKDILSII